jgi:hypothetical protein
MKKQMSLEQKRDLIVSDPVKVFHKFITANNYQMWSAITLATNSTLVQVVGSFTTENSRIASKNAMLVMLNLELL